MNIGISFGSILLAAFIFYFVIKAAVKKAIIEAKVYEAELVNDVESTKEFNELTTIFYGPLGVGTEVFDGLTKEQKEVFKPEWKILTKRYNQLLRGTFEGKKRDLQIEITALQTEVNNLIDRINEQKEV